MDKLQDYASSSSEEEDIDVESIDHSSLERELSGLLVSTFRRVAVSLKLMNYCEWILTE